MNPSSSHCARDSNQVAKRVRLRCLHNNSYQASETHLCNTPLRYKETWGSVLDQPQQLKQNTGGIHPEQKGHSAGMGSATCLCFMTYTNSLVLSHVSFFGHFREFTRHRYPRRIRDAPMRAMR
eukprot:5402495-Amphidinium_carterae.2